MPDLPDADARTEALQDETRRLRMLRTVVDLTTSILQQGRVSRAEAEALVAASRRRILDLFPDKESTYELILAPRFARLVEEFAVAAPRPEPRLPSHRGASADESRVLPFRR